VKVIQYIALSGVCGQGLAFSVLYLLDFHEVVEVSHAGMATAAYCFIIALTVYMTSSAVIDSRKEIEDRA